MKSSTIRFGLVAAVHLSLVLGAVSMLSTRSDETTADAPMSKKPAALARHLERLRQALPGTEGFAAGGGLASLIDEQFLQRAYPATDIPLAFVQQSREDFFGANSNFPRGNKPGTWNSVGPLEALYQKTEFRTSASYVPNEFAAGGRTTALAIAPSCTTERCRLYAAAAGGGVWRTDDALAAKPKWRFLSGKFQLNAVGAIVIDPTDPTGNTIYAGTGESNSCGVCAAGAGLYKSTDGGETWTGPLGVGAFRGRAIGTIAIHPHDPNTIYVGTGRGVRGVSSVTGGVVSFIPGAPKWGLYKSTDGGTTWTFIHNGAASPAVCTGDSAEAGGQTPCSPRGVRQVALDPWDPQVVYASSYQRGVWRSTDGGTTWTLVFAPVSAGAAVSHTERAEMALAKLMNGRTRMYIGAGSLGPPLAPPARLVRTDDARATEPVFVELSSPDPALPGFGSYNYCTGQCWYDQQVVSPAGEPDVVYLLGSYQYGETGGVSNGRTLALSTDAGVTWNDLTMDATDATHPNGIHPDAHAVVVNPNNPFQFFQASDGGVVRSSGEFADMSHTCSGRRVRTPVGSRVMLATEEQRCRQLLSRVPTEITSINTGYQTLQFMSLSVNPADSSNLQGGTQDNGTWETKGSRRTWLQTIWGDGGQSGFDVANPAFRFHTFFQATPDVNFSSGAIHDWNWVGDRVFGIEPQPFYIAAISDPKVSRTMFLGLSHVWRTKTHGMGSMSLDEFRHQCNEFTGVFEVQCGDFEPLAADFYNGSNAPSQTSRLTDIKYGTDRMGGTVAAVERTSADASTLWAATSSGRVFISKNADADPASAVTFVRLDNKASNDPNRFVSGIHIDSANPNRAWVAYSGFNASTPSLPGHIFEVQYNPASGTATWTSLDHDLGDVPLTDVVRDTTGDLYVSTDYGVLRLAAGTATWTQAAPGLPTVMVAGLTMTHDRKLYAATHGLGAWILNLP